MRPKVAAATRRCLVEAGHGECARCSAAYRNDPAVAKKERDRFSSGDALSAVLKNIPHFSLPTKRELVPSKKKTVSETFPSGRLSRVPVSLRQEEQQEVVAAVVAERAAT